MDVPQITKVAHGEKSTAQKELSPNQEPKKTAHNIVNVSTHRHLFPPSQYPNQGFSLEQKSNSSEEVRIKGLEKLTYIKKCIHEKRSKEQIFENYPFCSMDAFTFPRHELAAQDGSLQATILQNSAGIHLVQEYRGEPTGKYVTAEEERASRQFNGLSVSVFEDGSIFEGIYHDSHFCGVGYELQPDGNTFIGNFKDGVKNGSGTYYWFSSNEAYSGEWHGGVPHGEGMYLGEGERYEGMFSNGLKFGFGMERFANGDRYVGAYVNGVAEGYGDYFWKDGSVYKGDFRQGVRHGYGIWRDEREAYQGNYRLDRKEGLGVYRWTGRQVYKGEFRDDFREGYGEFYLAKGEKEVLAYKGCWLQGKKWEEGKVEERKVRELLAFLDESPNLARELEELGKKNGPRRRVGHKNCIPRGSNSDLRS